MGALASLPTPRHHLPYPGRSWPPVVRPHVASRGLTAFGARKRTPALRAAKRAGRRAARFGVTEGPPTSGSRRRSPGRPATPVCTCCYRLGVLAARRPPLPGGAATAAGRRRGEAGHGGKTRRRPADCRADAQIRRRPNRSLPSSLLKRLKRSDNVAGARGPGDCPGAAPKRGDASRWSPVHSRASRCFAMLLVASRCFAMRLEASRWSIVSTLRQSPLEARGRFGSLLWRHGAAFAGSFGATGPADCPGAAPKRRQSPLEREDAPPGGAPSFHSPSRRSGPNRARAEHETGPVQIAIPGRARGAAAGSRLPPPAVQ